jgi:hypothetical protein
VKEDFGDMTIEEQYYSVHGKNELEVCREIINEIFPDYILAYKPTMYNTSCYTCNIFVMKKNLADQYCHWLFSILFELENRYPSLEYGELQPRICGFLSERLFNVWLEKNQLKIKEIQMVMK